MGFTELRAAAQQALEILERLHGGCTDSDDGTVEAITIWVPEIIDALRAALAEPTTEESSEVEPVAWMHTDAYNPKNRHLEWSENRRGYLGDWIKTPLYAAPPERKPLTEEEIAELARQEQFLLVCDGLDELTEIARAIELAHEIGGQP